MPNDTSRYRVKVKYPWLSADRDSAAKSLHWPISRGLSKMSAEQLLAGQRIRNVAEAETIVGLVRSGQLEIFRPDAGGGAGARVVPSQVMLLLAA